MASEQHQRVNKVLGADEAIADSLPLNLLNLTAIMAL
jgi:hypothetical protein